ncbi:protein ROOT PRIMORDIUM DEFECTIVE 1 [Amborella trichopoda]|uniref:PORR domain-containing protein n=1 Tax=Amborella trichopoda TaxID=13333 RepID=W1P6P6_AMBTC|nr:protein ROOT PRIMORDIUM DEFECTIVE 1 [Amborella trichopoda]ERN05557.1 hypothetical protein AMTR_s00007p00266080 [Amborella trichopoda]|eukprot:XP_006843882.1 protein ROOT PRIMORDIUM DEFECTIVE 1 [Amborella trichopoda]
MFRRRPFVHLFLTRPSSQPCNYQQRFSLVNIKLKWVKDPVLDTVVAMEKDLKAVCELKDMICRHADGCLPIYQLSKRRRQMGIEIRVSRFMRRYPTIFHEFIRHQNGCPLHCFKLTQEARCLHEEEQRCQEVSEEGTVQRLCKLLMLTKKRILPLQTIDQLKWDMGLFRDYDLSLIPRYPQLFQFVKLEDDRIGLELSHWDCRLAVSQLERNCGERCSEGDTRALAFPIKFTRGFGLRKKCMDWLREWQRLPYTSPYVDASHLNPRTDESEKRIVGVFHELLYLTIGRKTERKNLSNLRKPLGLPQKFTKVFERHPGIFYISQKSDTHTVILREAFDAHQLIEKHPLVGIREKYIEMMKTGFLNKSRGLYKKELRDGHWYDQGLVEMEANQEETMDAFSE